MKASEGKLSLYGIRSKDLIFIYFFPFFFFSFSLVQVCSVKEMWERVSEERTEKWKWIQRETCSVGPFLYYNNYLTVLDDFACSYLPVILGLSTKLTLSVKLKWRFCPVGWLLALLSVECWVLSWPAIKLSIVWYQ